jgi:hypothetical protein
VEREHGVTHYAVGYARLKVAFPNGVVTCDYCPGCNKSDVRVYKCMWLGGQAFASADAKFGVLINCPIEFEEPCESD